MASFWLAPSESGPVPAAGLDEAVSPPPSFQQPVPVPRPGLGAHAQLGERSLEPAGPLLDGLPVVAQACHAEPVKAARPSAKKKIGWGER